jgi:hypothetical protein
MLQLSVKRHKVHFVPLLWFVLYLLVVNYKLSPIPLNGIAYDVCKEFVTQHVILLHLRKRETRKVILINGDNDVGNSVRLIWQDFYKIFSYGGVIRINCFRDFVREDRKKKVTSEMFQQIIKFGMSIVYSKFKKNKSELCLSLFQVNISNRVMLYTTRFKNNALYLFHNKQNIFLCAALIRL